MDELKKLIELLEKADLVILVFGEKKAGLGRDIQEIIINALKIVAEIKEGTA